MDFEQNNKNDGDVYFRYQKGDSVIFDSRLGVYSFYFWLSLCQFRVRRKKVRLELLYYVYGLDTYACIVVLFFSPVSVHIIF